MYYSESRKAYTRIDMIWVSKSMLSLTKKVDILPRILLDHNPVLWVLRGKRRTYKWKLNDLLDKRKTLEYIQNEINNFFELNWNKETRNSIVWDAFKVYIQGILVALNSKEKKTRDKTLKELQDKIKEKI